MDSKVQENEIIDSHYWKYPVGFVWAVLFTWAILGLSFVTKLDFVAFLMLPAIIALPICTFGSLYGIYKESKMLSAAEHDWVPHWFSYLLFHFIIGPLVVIPIYLIQRRRHLGTPTLHDAIYLHR